MTDLGEKIGIDTLFTPDTANGMSFVDYQDLCLGSETQICCCRDEAIPAWITGLAGI